MPQSTIIVLYITGWCRNGSTLIGNILNEIDGFFHVGELHYLWKNFLNRGTNTWCGCGKSLATCQVWRQVLSMTFNAQIEEQAEKVMAYQECVRTRHIWQVLRYQDNDDRRLTEYADILSRTFRSIHAFTGAKVIIDGSKYPAEGALLPHVEGVRPVYLHLVRDPRASAYSWSRVKDYIPSMSAMRSTAYWVGFNFASDLIRKRYPDSSLFLRYEDFIAAPSESINRILVALSKDPANNPLQGRMVTLGANHTVTGNPDRFVSGQVAVRSQDVDWRRELPRQTTLIATLMSLPFMRRYGY